MTPACYVSHLTLLGQIAGSYAVTLIVRSEVDRWRVSLARP